MRLDITEGGRVRLVAEGVEGSVTGRSNAWFGVRWDDGSASVEHVSGMAMVCDDHVLRVEVAA